MQLLHTVRLYTRYIARYHYFSQYKLIYNCRRQPYFFFYRIFIYNRVSARRTCMSWLISFAYAWIYSSCKEREARNYEMKNSCPQRDSNSSPLVWEATVVTIRLSDLVFYRHAKMLPVFFTSFFFPTNSFDKTRGRVFLSCI